MECKTNRSLMYTLISTIILSIIIYMAIIIKTHLTFIDSLKLIPLPFAWTGSVQATFVLGVYLIRKIILKKEMPLNAWGAPLLSITSAGLLIVWLLLLRNAWGDASRIEELLFPLVLFSGLLLLSLTCLWKKKCSQRTNITFLVLAILLFTLPRESGDISWNLYNCYKKTSTNTTSSNNSNSMNWGNRSIFPGENGATYTINYAGIGGPVGEILRNKYGQHNQYPANAAHVTISGTIPSPTVTSLFPVIKWGDTKAQLNVTIYYLLSNIIDDTDLQTSQSLRFNASINTVIDVKQRVLGVASARTYNELLANEIDAILKERIEKELKIQN